MSSFAARGATDHIEGLISVLDRVPVGISACDTGRNKLFDAPLAAAERDRVESCRSRAASACA